MRSRFWFTRALTAAVASLAFMVASRPAEAADYTWNTNSPSSWSSLSAWLPTSPPTTGTNVNTFTFPSVSAASVTATVRSAQYTFSALNFTGTTSYTLSHASGTLSPSSGAVINVSTTKLQTVSFSGSNGNPYSINIAPSGTLKWGSLSLSSRLSPVTFTGSNAASTLDVATNAYLPKTFTQNGGLVKVNPGVNLPEDSYTQNGGTVSVLGSTTSDINNIVGTGTYTLQGGAALNLAPGAVITQNIGTMNVFNSTVTWGNSTAISAIGDLITGTSVLDMADLNGAGHANVNTSVQLDAGTLLSMRIGDAFSLDYSTIYGVNGSNASLFLSGTLNLLFDNFYGYDTENGVALFAQFYDEVGSLIQGDFLSVSSTTTNSGGDYAGLTWSKNGVTGEWESSPITSGSLAGSFFRLDRDPVDYAGTYSLTVVSVPEPTQMVFLAGVGASFGAWRLVRRRGGRGHANA